MLITAKTNNFSFQSDVTGFTDFACVGVAPISITFPRAMPVVVAAEWFLGIKYDTRVV